MIDCFRRSFDSEKIAVLLRFGLGRKRRFLWEY